MNANKGSLFISNAFTVLDLKSVDRAMVAPRTTARPPDRAIHDGLLLLIAFSFLLCHFAQKLNTPWLDHADFNGAVWSQAGHNLIAGGLKENLGISAPFYYDPPPIPRVEYYDHHPALLALTVAGAFEIFGEHEWAARLVPIVSSLVSLMLLWLLARSSEGSRAAAFSVAIFAFLPMEMVWGQMVNFEPLTLMWMLAGFLGFQRWQLTGGRQWQVLMWAGFTLSMLTSWMGYIFVLVLCAWFLIFERRRYSRLALQLLGIALITAMLFLLQISYAKAGSTSDLWQAFWLRAGHSTADHTFTFWEWTCKVGGTLIHYFSPLVLGLAALGAATTFRERSEKEFGIGWISACFFFTNALYDIAFRNASYIHDYASFYFIVPVALMGGKGLLSITQWVRKHYPAITNPGIGAGVCVILLLLGFTGWSTAQKLQLPVHILTWEKPEPENLIPALGKVIKDEFSKDVTVLANFDISFSPQLCYYSQTKLANGLIYGEDWRDYISGTDDKTAGIIWMGDENAKGIVALLPPGSKRFISVEGVPFCIWKQ